MVMGRGVYRREDSKVMGFYSLAGAHSAFTDCARYVPANPRDILAVDSLLYTRNVVTFVKRTAIAYS